MILHGYGCSWTQGEGSDVSVESTLKNEDLNQFRNEHSWLKILANKIGIDCRNNGVSGNSNNNIFNKIVLDITDGIIKSDDLVIIMWSSSLRDSVTFLPKGEWVSWSVKHLIQYPEKFVNSFKNDDNVYTEFIMKYKNFFVSELFNQNYYNIVNQNYIVFVQKLLNHYGIKYIMCDSFEPMLIDLHKKDDVTHTIDKSTYWGFGKETFRDFLNKTNRLDIWEHQDTTYNTRATQHPNKIGYNLISQELYNYIVDNNII
jgi:hypothetical protein